jgi:hypothetical protein
MPGTRTEIPSSMIYNGQRFRFIWNRLYFFPQEKTFHDFLHYVLVQTFGQKWFDKEGELPEAERHVVVRWRKALGDLVKDGQQTADGGWIETGPVKAYMSLAYDLYWLQLIHKLPKSLERRLRDKEAFQGARYEVLIAAVFARAGFEIELLDETVKAEKHCEFVAIHKSTRAKVYVEAKSRRRPGVLHQPGCFTEADIRGDLFGLYGDAMKQAPKGEAYLIFIDANLPVKWPEGVPAYGTFPFERLPWVDEFGKRLHAKWESSNDPNPETAVVVTNFAPHFGNETDPAPIGLFAPMGSPRPTVPLTNDKMIDDLFYCLRLYETIPRQF